MTIFTYCYRLLRIHAIRKLFPPLHRAAHHLAHHKAHTAIICLAIGLPPLFVWQLLLPPAGGYIDERVPVPEPGSAALLVVPVLAILALRRRRL
jgi:hypothetical protein